MDINLNFIQFLYVSEYYSSFDFFSAILMYKNHFQLAGSIKSSVWLNLAKKSVLFSRCHCSKLPHTRWLRTTETYSPTVLDARSLKYTSRCWWGCTFSRGFREDSISCSLHLPVPPASCWPSLPSLYAFLCTLGPSCDPQAPPTSRPQLDPRHTHW